MLNLQDRIILTLCKERQRHNPSTLAKELNVTRMGVYKALKTLEQAGIVTGEQLGKAVFYALNLQDTYVRKRVEVLFMEEVRLKQRWVDEFKELSIHVEAIILFGSILVDEKNARDIDLLLILTAEQNKDIKKILNQKQHILSRRIHLLKQTPDDFRKNLEKRDKVLETAIQHGVVLHGVETYVRLLHGYEKYGSMVSQ